METMGLHRTQGIQQGALDMVKAAIEHLACGYKDEAKELLKLALDKALMPEELYEICRLLHMHQLWLHSQDFAIKGFQSSVEVLDETMAGAFLTAIDASFYECPNSRHSEQLRSIIEGLGRMDNMPYVKLIIKKEFSRLGCGAEWVSVIEAL